MRPLKRSILVLVALLLVMECVPLASAGWNHFQSPSSSEASIISQWGTSPPAPTITCGTTTLNATAWYPGTVNHTYLVTVVWDTGGTSTNDIELYVQATNGSWSPAGFIGVRRDGVGTGSAESVRQTYGLAIVQNVNVSTTRVLTTFQVIPQTTAKYFGVYQGFTAMREAPPSLTGTNGYVADMKCNNGSVIGKIFDVNAAVFTPPQPLGVGVENKTSSLNVSWSSSSSATDYWITRTSSCPGAATAFFNVVAPTTFLDDGAVVQGYSYTYVVTPHNSAGNGTASDTARGTTAVAGVAGHVASGSTLLSWTAPPCMGASMTYNVFRDGIQIGSSSTASYTDSHHTLYSGYAVQWVSGGVNGPTSPAVGVGLNVTRPLLWVERIGERANIRWNDGGLTGVQTFRLTEGGANLTAPLTDTYYSGTVHGAIRDMPRGNYTLCWRVEATNDSVVLASAFPYGCLDARAAPIPVPILGADGIFSGSHPDRAGGVTGGAEVSASILHVSVTTYGLLFSVVLVAAGAIVGGQLGRAGAAVGAGAGAVVASAVGYLPVWVLILAALVAAAAYAVARYRRAVPPEE